MESEREEGQSSHLKKLAAFGEMRFIVI